jgi:hypothetical protein
VRLVHSFSYRSRALFGSAWIRDSHEVHTYTPFRGGGPGAITDSNDNVVPEYGDGVRIRNLLYVSVYGGQLVIDSCLNDDRLWRSGRSRSGDEVFL